MATRACETRGPRGGTAFQDDGGTWIPGDLENLLRGGDCLEVVNLRPAWNDDEVGDAGGL